MTRYTLCGISSDFGVLNRKHMKELSEENPVLCEESVVPLQYKRGPAAACKPAPAFHYRHKQTLYTSMCFYLISHALSQ